VLGNTLWETVWFNVLERPQIESIPCDPAQPKEDGCYPWMAPTETSEDGQGTNPSQKHPLHVYWAMPRRIRLMFEPAEQARCDICGNETDIAVTRYWAKNLGYNYIGPWEHPLTPYSRQGQNEPYPMKGSPTGIRYRNWLGLIDRHQASSSMERMPARVITVFRDQRTVSARESGSPDYRVWAFGYDMDNMKARAWVEGIVPVYEIRLDLRSKYAEWIERYIQCAERVANNLRQALRKGLFDSNREVKPDNSLLTALDLRFWTDTEEPFYRALRKLRDALESDMHAPPSEDRLHWLHNVLFRRAQILFNEAVGSGEFEAEKHRRIALAWDQLTRFNSLRVKFFQTVMDLHQDAKQGV
jgi:CRISPR system Cascade subunit CasA